MQELWGLPQKGASWAAAGYQGAISSGSTTCGLLTGCTLAIGLKLGRSIEDNPQEHEEERKQAIAAVSELYRGFLEEFHGTGCRELIGLDFSVPEERQAYIDRKVWKAVCDVCLDFVMNKCFELEKEGII